MMSVLAEVTLGREPDAPALAREFAREVLREVDADGLEQLTDEVVLLLSELVTNAVMHARSDWVRIELSLDATGVRGVVVDADAASAPVRRQALVGGLGLVIVEALATRSGCDRMPNGKAVWFELDLPDAAPT